jgi:transcription antitermination protein NusB
LSARRRARELVLKSLYAYESTGGEPEEIIESLLIENEMAEKPREFASGLFSNVIKNLRTIDGEIEKHAEHWDISRLALVDKYIMRISVCELLFMPDIPARVSINEAIELAKKFSTEESASFVNGILNAVFKKHEAEFET